MSVQAEPDERHTFVVERWGPRWIVADGNARANYSSLAEAMVSMAEVIQREIDKREGRPEVRIYMRKLHDPDVRLACGDYRLEVKRVDWAEWVKQ